MNEFLQDFAEVFVPLFAVTSALPVLPIVISATEELPPKQRGRTLRQAYLTTVIVGTFMILVGGDFLSYLGVSLDDFRIAGGIILLVFAVHDLLFTRAERKQKAVDVDELFETDHDHHPDDEEDIGIVPLGIPILFGPASMTALIVFSQTAEPVVIYPAFVLNFAVNGLLIWRAGPVARRLGRPLIRATGKVMGVVLAALAVSMLRVGLTNIVNGS